MPSKLNIHDPNVQYIATYDFMQTLINSEDLPDDLLNLMYDNYDFMADPGIDQLGFDMGATGTGHRMERDFMDEYRGRSAEISSYGKRLALNKQMLRSPRRDIPWQIVAMALQRSTDGKQRVILTDDEGLEELLQYYGIQTMESDDFKRKLVDDHVIEGDDPEPDKPEFSQEKHDSSLLLARRLDQQRREQTPGIPDPDTTNTSGKGKKLGGIDMDD